MRLTEIQSKLTFLERFELRVEHTEQLKAYLFHI